MLYDPQWKKIEAPTEIPALKPWQQILLDAVEVIHNYGWISGAFQDGEGGKAKVCRSASSIPRP
jgi:hypothetical protein